MFGCMQFSLNEWANIFYAIKQYINTHPAKLFSHLVAIYIVCYEMGASAHYFNTYQYLHIWTVVGNAWSYLYRTDFFCEIHKFEIYFF